MVYTDRGVLASLITTLQNHPDHDEPGLGLSKVEAGALGSVFMLGYMVAGPIFAFYAQIVQPFFLIAIGLVIWALSSLGAGLSTTFWQILVARALSGIGEASFVCLAPPFILDNAPSARKTTWIAIFYSAIAFGYALGYIFGNFINIILGGWYWPFYIQTLIFIPFIILCIVAEKDDKMLSTRKNHGDDFVEVISLKQQFKELGENLVFVLIVLGFASLVFSVGGLSYWTPTVIEMYYLQSPSIANNSLGIITLVCGIFGTLIGSVMLDYIVKSTYESQENEFVSLKDTYTELCCLFCTVTTILSVVSAFIGIIINTFYPYIIGVGIAEFFIFM